MDTRILNYFLTVTQTGNITKAAEVLHMTQPTLSRQLIALEEELGVLLFDRGAREVTLTENGIIFQQRALEILSLIEKTERDMTKKKTQLTGTVMIGCVESKASLLLTEAIQKFHELHPQVVFDLYSANGDEIKEKIDWGQIDIGIVLEPVEIAKYEFFTMNCFERWGIILSKEDPLANKKILKVEDILDLPIFMSRREIVIEENAKWLGIRRSKLPILIMHNLLTNSVPLIDRGIGRSISIEGALNLRTTEMLKFVPLYPLKTSNHAIIWKKNKVFNRVTHVFLDFLEEVSLRHSEHETIES